MQSSFFFDSKTEAPKFSLAVLELATKYHKGQTRKNSSQPYISHPIAVEKIANKMAHLRGFSSTEREVISSIAFAHDLLEDTKCTPDEIKSAVILGGGQEIEARAVVEGVEMLTRPTKDKDIIEYLEPIRRHSYPKIVKLADLEHNMSDLQPSNLLDKYKLCRHYLQSHGA